MCYPCTHEWAFYMQCQPPLLLELSLPSFPYPFLWGRHLPSLSVLPGPSSCCSEQAFAPVFSAFFPLSVSRDTRSFSFKQCSPWELGVWLAWAQKLSFLH